MLRLKPTVMGLTRAEVREVELRCKQRQQARAAAATRSRPATSRKLKETSSTSCATVIGPSRVAGPDPFEPSIRVEDIAPSTSLFSHPSKRVPRFDNAVSTAEGASSAGAGEPLPKSMDQIEGPVLIHKPTETSRPAEEASHLHQQSPASSPPVRYTVPISHHKLQDLASFDEKPRPVSMGSVEQVVSLTSTPCIAEVMTAGSGQGEGRSSRRRRNGKS
jgi:hypothetical protein